MVNAESLTDMWELLITDNKTTLAKCGVQCIRPIRGPNIACQRYKGMLV